MKFFSNRLDRLIYRELLGPYVFGVAMFTVLILAATYLFSITNYIVKGVPIITIFEVTLLFIPGILVKTFAMAMLLSGLLAFGRLSNDSEVIAMRAAGATMTQIMRPVVIFSLVVAIVAFGIDETVVPWASQKSEQIAQVISLQLDPTRTTTASEPIVEKGKVLGMVIARDANLSTGTLRGATVVVYDPKTGQNQWILWANKLQFEPQLLGTTNGGWIIEGGATLQSADGSTFTKIDNRAWPPQVPKPQFTVEDLIAGQLKNLDVLNMKGILKEIHRLRKDPHSSPSQIRNLEFGYWNKIALPIAALVYGLLGAPLGIRNSRSSTAAGFALAVGIIFGYVTLINLLNVYAMNGVIPPWTASFTPVLGGLVAAILIIRNRNR